MTDNRVFKTAGDASRRTVMSGIVGVGVGVPLLAACGAEDSESPEDGGGDTGGGDRGRRGGIGVGAHRQDLRGAGGWREDLQGPRRSWSARPSEGEFKAFSTICTHEGCKIIKVDGDEIECGCHFSRFAIADGSVAKGPATKPLKELKVTVKGDDLTVS